MASGELDYSPRRDPADDEVARSDAAAQDPPIADAQARLEKACERIRNIPFKFRSEDIRITVSVGIAELQQVNQSLTSLFETADNALYEAKKTGRNKIVLASAVSN